MRRWSARRCCLYSIASGCLSTQGAVAVFAWTYHRMYGTWDEFWRMSWWLHVAVLSYAVGVCLGALMYTIQWYMNRH